MKQRRTELHPRSIADTTQPMPMASSGSGRDSTEGCQGQENQVAQPSHRPARAQSPRHGARRPRIFRAAPTDLRPVASPPRSQETLSRLLQSHHLMANVDVACSRKLRAAMKGCEGAVVRQLATRHMERSAEERPAEHRYWAP